MKKFLLLFLFMSNAAFAAGTTYALAVFHSTGSIAEGSFSMAIAGGDFDTLEDGSLARYSKNECVQEIRSRLLGIRAYSTMFRYSGGGAYREGGTFGRMVCIDYDIARRYLRNSRFWNIDLRRFFNDFRDKVPSSFVPADFANYSIFPLDDGDSGMTAVLNSGMSAANAMQRTSYDCNATDLDKSSSIVCRDRTLAELDIRTAAMYNELVVRHSDLARVKNRWDVRRHSTFFPAGLERLYRSMLDYLSCVKERDGLDSCVLEEF